MPVPAAWTPEDRQLHSFLFIIDYFLFVAIFYTFALLLLVDVCLFLDSDITGLALFYVGFLVCSFFLGLAGVKDCLIFK